MITNMKKTLLLAGLAIAGSTASAQCTPNQLYADSVYGVWPDTTTDFVSGMVAVFYSDTLQLLVPSDAGLINSTYAGYTIDSVALTSVDGLPPGLAVECNSQTSAPCTFLPTVVGCGLIEGFPTTAGTYDITVNVTAYTLVFGFTLPVPQSFGGYHIVVGPALGVDETASLNLDQVTTTPNPFTQRTSIDFNLSHAATTKLKVFNLLGEEQWRRTVEAKQGLNNVPFDGSSLDNGIYLYKLEAGDRTFTGRMVVSR